MKFGISISNTGPTAHRESMVALAGLAQELNFDSIWVGDHVFLPYQMSPIYPYSATGKSGLQPSDNIFDPLITLGFMAAKVDKLMLGIGVLVIPYRNPLVMAKMLATLDVLSKGRLVLGIGVGWMREEFETLGASFEDRGSVTDEYIQIFKGLCTTEEFDFQGEHYQVSNVAFYPRPAQSPHPPVWVGGHSSSALKRVVRLGDGWQPAELSPSELAEKLEVIRRLCHAAGRDPDTIEISNWLSGVGFGDVEPGADGRVARLSGTPQQMLDTVRRYEEAGVRHLAMGIRRGTAGQMAETVKRFAGEVIAKL